MEKCQNKNKNKNNKKKERKENALFVLQTDYLKNHLLTVYPAPHLSAP